MTLRTKLLAAGILLTSVPLAVIAAVTYRQNTRMVEAAEAGCTELAYKDLDHIAEGVYSMCRAQQDLLEQKVVSDLNVARDVLSKAGGAQLDAKEMAEWSATNQYTKQGGTVRLPKMKVGKTWLGQNKSMDTATAVVDEVQNLVGATCTVFQRMNDAGDMLRVATNVEKLDGTRAIGTYLPAVNPDGGPNPVLSKVLRGETFIGRAYVVNKWYITAYEPIRDQSNRIVGVLYVGVPQESVKSLREEIMRVVVGKTGYVFVLDSKGNYVISAGGKRDGESIWNAKDSNGALFIQEIVKKSRVLKPGEIAEQQYPWKNSGEQVARMKVARLMYFEPWDWVIGASSYVDEFHEAREQVSALGEASNVPLLSVAGVSVALAVGVWLLMARGLTGRILRIVESLRDGSEQVSAASGQVSATSQTLAEGCSEQAASIEETSASIEEMASMTKQNAANANEAKNLMTQAQQVVSGGQESMGRVSSAISEIKKSADATAKIIKTIDDIAFQTNLLALNAAVEAARAGEAGKGFAVVAEEVRNLAQRSAEAARNTADMIQESVKNSENGVAVSEEAARAFDAITESSAKVGQLVNEIAAASAEQSQGIDQVNTAVGQMDAVTQRNASGAEESASAAEELSAQAHELRSLVQRLNAVVLGAKANAAGAPGERRFEADKASAAAAHTRQPQVKPMANRPAAAPRRPEEVIPLETDGGNLSKF